VLAVDLDGVFYTVRAAIPTLERSAHGRVICTASHYGVIGAPEMAHYSAAKGGVIGFVKALARELAPAITVNAVAPFARTRVTDIIQPANDAQKTYKERALKIGAHHVANLVTALCSPAGKGITGQLLGVRGREVFLFGQPRPVARIEAGATLAQDLSAKFSDKFTDLTTDLEAFNTEPLV
jgi:NAD(P)-dependent dehydrogenase (short-subunit alcohol dehydrogenase family)